MIVENDIRLGQNIIYPSLKPITMTLAEAEEMNPSELYLTLSKYLDPDYNNYYNPNLISAIDNVSDRLKLYRKYYDRYLQTNWYGYRTALVSHVPDLVRQFEEPGWKPEQQTSLNVPVAPSVPSAIVEFSPVASFSKIPAISIFEKTIKIPGIETEIPVLYLLIGGGALALFLLLRD